MWQLDKKRSKVFISKKLMENQHMGENSPPRIQKGDKNTKKKKKRALQFV